MWVRVYIIVHSCSTQYSTEQSDNLLPFIIDYISCSFFFFCVQVSQSRQLHCLDVVYVCTKNGLTDHNSTGSTKNWPGATAVQQNDVCWWNTLGQYYAIIINNNTVIAGFKFALLLLLPLLLWTILSLILCCNAKAVT